MTSEKDRNGRLCNAGRLFSPPPPEPSTFTREVLVLSLIIGPAIASVVYGVSESRRNTKTIKGMRDDVSEADYIQRSELESWRRSLEESFGDELPVVPFHNGAGLEN